MKKLKLIFMKKLKLIVKNWLFVSLCSWVIYFLIWLMSSFVNFRFDHPFAWIINLPDYDPEDRFGIMFLWMSVISIKVILTYRLVHEKKKIKNNDQKPFKIPI